MKIHNIIIVPFLEKLRQPYVSSYLAIPLFLWMILDLIFLHSAYNYTWSEMRERDSWVTASLSHQLNDDVDAMKLHLYSLHHFASDIPDVVLTLRILHTLPGCMSAALWKGWQSIADLRLSFIICLYCAYLRWKCFESCPRPNKARDRVALHFKVIWGHEGEGVTFPKHM